MICIHGREIPDGSDKRKLLTVSGDAKTAKGEAFGYLTGILYLAPHTLAGVGNVCANASPGCIKACLYTAGRAEMFPAIGQARIARTRYFVGCRECFMLHLRKEIVALVRRAEKLGLTPLVRLNGTSDLPWENIHVADLWTNIMTAFPNVQFYDYTKSFTRMRWFLAGSHVGGASLAFKAWPKNYSLTFSRSECNEPDAIRALEMGGNVAVPFSTRKGKALPATWHGFTVTDGDVSDARPSDAHGVVIGLRAKGRARKDTSGFVVAA